MSESSVSYATFSLERTYHASPSRVFEAWSDPKAKAQWFAGPAFEYDLDFRVGGREVNRGRHNGAVMTFESFYRDIVAGERIVYASTLSIDETVSTVSITTVQISSADDGTRLVLTEQGTFLDGLEQPSWREQGTGEWLDALGTQLDEPSRA